MSVRPSFDPKELEVAGAHASGYALSMKAAGILPPNAPDSDLLYNWPISPRENFKLAFSGEKPYWLPRTGMSYSEVCNFRPRIFPDNIVTHLVFDGESPIQYETNTMRGWFSLDWVYVPVAGGATVKPGNPLIEDMNDWEKLVVWPDLDAMDWEEMGRKNREYLITPQLNQLGLLDGFWERLISLMDVSGAAMALVDEDQQDAVHAFFDKYADPR